MILRIALGAVGIVALLLAGAVFTAGRGVFGTLEVAGEPVPVRRDAAALARREAAQRHAARAMGAVRPAASLGGPPGGARAKQILFGDLHAHTTFSTDAFTFSLPMVGGEGAHPPADACDFARHCAALDFWSINDHAEELTPRQWDEIVASTRQCDALAGEPPDLVSFLGWEWTQAGTTPENHYGHKNVVLRHTDAARIPARPIGAELPPGSPVVGRMGTMARGAAALAMGGRFHDWAAFLTEREETPRCEPGRPVRELPEDCIELAATPAELFDKLDDWGHDALVIPHGTTWGVYTPPGSSWDKQLVGDQHDPERQRLIEIYSGHGASEVYRAWRAIDLGAEGSDACPAPSPGYLPSCWRAGEIIRERCAGAGESPQTCDERARAARANYLEGGIPGHLTVPGARAEDWLDAGQCQDCMQPAFNYRPASAAQYILALGGFDAGGSGPRRFRLGFLASSDNHFARPGSGYKEKHRRGMTESMGASRDQDDLGPLASMIAPPDRDPLPRSMAFEDAARGVRGFQLLETERSIAFLLTGGLVAVHAEGRDRDAIWTSLDRREVYGTTGPRILLWFDLLNPPGSSAHVAPMGSEVTLAEAPIFRARAVGSFEQLPGCPAPTAELLGPDELMRLCKGDCYHPGDARRTITRIEVVRIRPRTTPDEDVAGLIDDPWRRFDCEPDPAGCAVTFSDPDFVAGAREAVYYVRAFESPAPGINAGNLRCERDLDGRCTGVSLCPGPAGGDDECLAEHEPRAWSSPIFVTPGSERPRPGRG